MCVRAVPRAVRYSPGVRIGIISDTHLPSVIRELDELGPQIGEFLATLRRALDE